MTELDRLLPHMKRGWGLDLYVSYWEELEYSADFSIGGLEFLTMTEYDYETGEGYSSVTATDKTLEGLVNQLLDKMNEIKPGALRKEIPDPIETEIEIDFEKPLKIVEQVVDFIRKFTGWVSGKK